MENKFICENCKEDLREVGVYKKTKLLYVYIEKFNTFEVDKDCEEEEEYFCNNCNQLLEI